MACVSKTLHGMIPAAAELLQLVAAIVVGCTFVATIAHAWQPDAAEKLASPEDVAINTTDDVTLSATFYPSRRGKEAACVILIHDDGGKRAECDRLARKLQAQGVAVIVPDLRGHGDSTGDFKQLRLDDYQAMVQRDLEAVKGFLLKRNNLGELNIERLGVVGIHLGAALALNWAAHDWNWPELATGKQGQDVKALAIISPEWGYKGVRIGEAVVEPGVQSEISIFIVAGRRNNRYYNEARRLHNSFARFHDVSLPAERRTLFFQTPSTSLQGLPLLNEPSFDVEGMIVEFVELRLVKPAIAWQMRKPPL